MNWTDEIKEQIAEMLREGLTASQIAARIGGVSRNAVIGVVHRDKRLKAIGFKRSMNENGGVTEARARRVSVAASRSNKTVRGGQISRNRLVAAPPIVDLLDEAPDLPGAFGAPQVAGVSLMMLTEHRCKWPINDGGPFLFCGEAKQTGRPYCAFHASAALGKGTESERTAVRSALKIAA